MRLWPLAVLVGLFAGCAMVSGISSLEVVDCVRGPCDGAPDTAPADVPLDVADTAVDVRDADAALDAVDADVLDTTADAPDAGDAADAPVTCPEVGPDAKPDAPDGGSCSGTGGPTGVSIGGAYCIDATEVTNAQYAAFLAAKGSDVCNQPAVCAWNTSFVPASGWPAKAGQENHPVTFVDWCDAWAFCEWAGKRLCGKIGGGPNPQDAYANAASSQWYRACSLGGTRAYPYGPTYAPTACNGGDLDKKGTVPVASLASCVGGTSGLFDMSGNVWEWEDSCETGDGGVPAADFCRLRGGSFSNTSASLACAVDFFGPPTARSKAYNNVGFRCCSR